MNYYEIVKRLIGDIDQLGDDSRDDERFSNLEETCILVQKLISDIEYVARSKDSYESSVKKAGKYAHNFLMENGLINENQNT